MYNNREIQLVVAVDENDGIGFENRLPWSPIKEDMEWFKNKTENNIVIMGRKTRESLPEYPLPNRENVVISKTLTTDMLGLFSTVKHTGIFQNLDSALDNLTSYPPFKDKEIFIIGGAKLYKTALDMGIVDKIWMTMISGQYECDTFFPTLDNKWKTSHQDEVAYGKNQRLTRILMKRSPAA